MPKHRLLIASPALFFLILLFPSHSSSAQPEFDPKIPSPKSILGHEIGEQFTHFFQLEQYYRSVAQVSNRVQLIKYGETYEGRSLYLLIISSPENLGRLETIRRNLQALSDPRKTALAEAETLAKSTPPVCWLSYGVHGNESSSAEAALTVVY